MASIDFPIIRKLGGRDATVEKFRKRGLDVSRDAVRMWAARRQIPGDATLELMKIAEGEGVKYGSDDFIAEENQSDAA